MFVKYSPSPETASLEIPENVFDKQNEISDELNEFQTRYSRYLRCQNKDTADLVDPPCDLNGIDNFSNLQNAYKKLYSSMDGMTKVFDKQTKIGGKTVEVYNENEEQIDENYDNVLKMRKDLDNRLQFLKEYSDGSISPAFRMLDRVNLINTLLIISIISLVYYLFFHS